MTFALLSTYGPSFFNSFLALYALNYWIGLDISIQNYGILFAADIGRIMIANPLYSKLFSGLFQGAMMY